MTNLFDAQEAEARKDAGAALALSAAPDSWQLAAHKAMQELIASGLSFTADDVVVRAGLPNKSRSNSNNAVGGLFLSAQKRGLIVKTGRRIKSTRVAGHSREISEWRRA